MFIESGFFERYNYCFWRARENCRAKKVHFLYLGIILDELVGDEEFRPQLACIVQRGRQIRGINTYTCFREYNRINNRKYNFLLKQTKKISRDM